ncbi:MAG: hypothetical protein ACREKL_05185 [Chthoniobacterales bacterium]
MSNKLAALAMLFVVSFVNASFGEGAAASSFTGDSDTARSQVALNASDDMQSTLQPIFAPRVIHIKSIEPPYWFLIGSPLRMLGCAAALIAVILAAAFWVVRCIQVRRLQPTLKQ